MLVEVSAIVFTSSIEGSGMGIVNRWLCGRLIGMAVVRLRTAGRVNWFRASLDVGRQKGLWGAWRTGRGDWIWKPLVLAVVVSGKAVALSFERSGAGIVNWRLCGRLIRTAVGCLRTVGHKGIGSGLLLMWDSKGPWGLGEPVGVIGFGNHWS